MVPQVHRERRSIEGQFLSIHPKNVFGPLAQSRQTPRSLYDSHSQSQQGQVCVIAVRPTGLAPALFCISDRCRTPLATAAKWIWNDLNARIAALETAAVDRAWLQIREVALSGFEPETGDPKSPVIGRFTIGLQLRKISGE